MKLAMSNIAWERSLDEEVAKILVEHGFTGVEIAPTKIWPDLRDVTETHAKIERDRWAKMGLKVVAMQSLLFGRPELKLFGTNQDRDQMFEALKITIDLAGAMAIPVLVFGSPKNRLRLNLELDAATRIAIDFFKRTGDYAFTKGTTLCIEANAKVYGCDFINTSEEALAFVSKVDCPGIGLHLDLGNMVLEGENIFNQNSKVINQAKHYHLSAPQMSPLTKEALEPLWPSRDLLKKEYNNYVSVEMLTSKIDSAIALADIRSAANVSQRFASNNFCQI